MGFFRDLFGPRQPCALCQIGAQQWPATHSGSADWKVRGPGGETALLVCVPCRQFLLQTGLLHKHPMFALSALVRAGRARRPAPAEFMAHDSWRHIWVGLLSEAGVYSPEPAVLHQTIDRFAERFYLHSDLAQDVEERKQPDTASAGPSIPISGGNPEITIPYVSFDQASSQEEHHRLWLTAVSGAGNLLVPLIISRTAGRVTLPVARGCALAMVMQAHRTNLAATKDTQGLFAAARSLFETQWREWESAGVDPIAGVETASASMESDDAG